MSHPQASNRWTTGVAQVGSAWKAAEGELSGAGIRIPLHHSLAWAKLGLRNASRLLTIRDGENRIVAGVAVRMDRSRVLPWHYYLRVDRLDGLPSAVLEPTIAALVELARNDRRVLRLSVRLFSRGDRLEAANLLRQYGFQLSAEPEMYRCTLTLDLLRQEEEIFHGLHKTARRNIRHTQHSSLVQRTLTDPIYADRIRRLNDESMRRTGGRRTNLDWRALLELSGLHPELSRVSGLFLAQSDARPEALVAFGWGTMQGDHGTYTAAGTMRLPNLKASLSYPLLWDLIVWAKRQGAGWFDLGGVTLGDNPANPLQGISKFKRYFSHTLEEVSEEWVLEPNPQKARLAGWPRRGARFVSSLLGRAAT